MITLDKYFLMKIKDKYLYGIRVSLDFTYITVYMVYIAHRVMCTNIFARGLSSASELLYHARFKLLS